MVKSKHICGYEKMFGVGKLLTIKTIILALYNIYHNMWAMFLILCIHVYTGLYIYIYIYIQVLVILLEYHEKVDLFH
jgi:hypothetical protein